MEYKEAMLQEYHGKYDAHNRGTRAVFNFFYETIADMGIRSNLVACCGKDYKAYERFAGMICTNQKSKALFFENDPKRFKEISRGISSPKVKAVLGNIFHYPDYVNNFHARVEDIGVGLGIRFMIAHATGRLYAQSRRGGEVWKVQILDSALRKVSDMEVVELYNHYLSVIGMKLSSVGGRNINVRNPLSVESATLMEKYTDFTGKTCSIYNHPTELVAISEYGRVRQAQLFLFSCTNGSRMLQSMLVYK